MEEYEKYKMDKLIEYLKFTISAHLVAIGVVATFKEQFLPSSEINITFAITIVTLLFSFCAAMLGYMHLVGAFFEQPKHNKAIATFARKSSGALLMASVLSFFLQSMPWS